MNRVTLFFSVVLVLVLGLGTIAFLHVFHHAATAVLCHNQLNGQTSVVRYIPPL